LKQQSGKYSNIEAMASDARKKCKKQEQKSILQLQFGEKNNIKEKRWKTVFGRQQSASAIDNRISHFTFSLLTLTVQMREMFNAFSA